MKAFVQHLIKVLLGIAGFTCIFVGILLLVLPGPGWAMIFFGLSLLAIEFAWAKKVLRRTRGKVEGGIDWLKESKRFFRRSERSPTDEESDAGESTGKYGTSE